MAQPSQPDFQKKSSPAPVTAPFQAIAQRPFAPPADVAASNVQAPDVAAPDAPTLDSTPAFPKLNFQIRAAGGSPPPLQPKLTIGAPNDPYEQEADRVAAQVVQRISAPDANPANPTQSVQRHTTSEEDGLQRTPMLQRHSHPEEDGLQMQSAQPTGIVEGDASPDLESKVQRARGNGQALAPNLQMQMGQAMGADFSGVRVHTDPQADQLNRSIQAKAFTTGQDIFFRQGAYQPGNRGGQELIAHELTHVVQQQGKSIQRQPKKIQRHGDHGNHEEENLQRSIDGPGLETCPGCQCSSCFSNQSSLTGHSLTNFVLQRQINPAQQSHHQGCSCPTCGLGQINLQRKQESSHNPGCSCPQCSGKQDRIQAKFIDLHSHIQRANPTSHLIQRHSSWEHKALGDIAPEDLYILGASRNLEDGSDTAQGRELTATTTTNQNGQTQTSVNSADNVTLKMKDKKNQQQLVPIKRENILHVIQQEIRRLNHFKDLSNLAKNAKSAKDVEKRLQQREKKTLINEAIEEAEASGNSVEEASKAASESPEWNVRILAIGPLTDGSTEYVTYGEMNTLADIYGSVDELKKTDPKNLHGIILGIRQQSLFRFMELYEEVSGTQKYQEMASNKRSEEYKKVEYLGAKMAGRGVLGAAGGAIGLGLGAVGGSVSGALSTSKKWGSKVPVLGHLAGFVGGAVGGVFTGAYEGAKTGAEIGFKGLSPEKRDKFAGLGFEGAIGNTGVGGKEGNMMGELRFMGMIPGLEGKKQIKGDKTTDYSAGLARNACHFPPDSWNAWQRYHEKALSQADKGFKALKQLESWRLLLDDDVPPETVQSCTEKMEQAQNEALILNGFGDHFLQDSYASGHLIDKTKIMKFYVHWIDKQNKWDFHQDKNWRRVQNIAYGQENFAGGSTRYSDTMARDPQMVENQGGDKRKKHDQLGLKAASLSSDAQKLLQWWAQDVLSKSRLRNPREKKIKTLLEKGPLKDQSTLEPALKEMFKQGIIRVGSYETKQRGSDSVKVKLNETVTLREDYVPKTKEAKEKLKTKPTEAITEMSQDANWEDYMAFMNNALLQKSTNALHDYFCEKGLDVVTGDGFAFRVYGDDAMLQTNSSAGVKHSSETTRMSRLAIESAVTKGKPDHSTAEIKNRFPKQIVGDGGLAVTLDQWHNDGILKKVCEDIVFPKMRSSAKEYVMQVGAMGAKGTLGKLHKPHGEEVF